MSSNVCQQCGACCAAYRVAFHPYELDEAPGGKVPGGLVEMINDHTVCMRGTDSVPVRCAALGGKIGEAVKCHIYEWRPSPCHEMIPGSDGCNRARQRWGLAEIE